MKKTVFKITINNRGDVEFHETKLLRDSFVINILARGLGMKCRSMFDREYPAMRLLDKAMEVARDAIRGSGSASGSRCSK